MGVRVRSADGPPQVFLNRKREKKAGFREGHAPRVVCNEEKGLLKRESLWMGEGGTEPDTNNGSDHSCDRTLEPWSHLARVFHMSPLGKKLWFHWRPSF